MRTAGVRRGHTVSDDLLKRIANIVNTQGATSKERMGALREVLEAEGVIERTPVDEFAALRSKAIELSDVDGMPTFVAMGEIADRIKDGWIPGFTALGEDEAIALDRVLRIWEHEVRKLLALLLLAAERGVQDEAHRLADRLGSDAPWATLGQMAEAQDAVRARVRLPAHPHGECCQHYMKEEAPDAVALTARALSDAHVHDGRLVQRAEARGD